MLKRESARDWMKARIAHSLPGRLRLEVPGLQYIQTERHELARALAAIPGVRRARLNVPTAGVLLEYDAKRLDAPVMLERANLVIQKYAMTVYRSRHLGRREESAELSMPVSTLIKRLAVNAGAMAVGNTVFRAAGAQSVLGRFTSVQALVSLGLCAPIARSALEGLRRDMRPNADFLTVTSIVASLMLGNANSALMILALSDLAEMMTAYTIEKTRASIKQMLSVEDGSVWKVNADGGLTRCPISETRAGEVIEVHTGEKIAVDGAVRSGSAVVDQSAITGEFVPVERHEGDEVFAGTVVKNGNIRIEARKVGDQTVVSRIVGMVEASELKKAPIQRYADRFSNYLVPLNFLLSLTVGLVTRNPQKALKMLVIDYSCGIKLSTATAFSATINAAVRQGILIKGGAYIEQMSQANTVLLDKTGTITEGKPKVVSMQVLADGIDENTLLALAMAAEETSSHPLAGAILAYGAQRGVAIPAHGEVVTEVSRGSRTTVDGKTVRVGNLKYMRENGVSAGRTLPDPGVSIANYVGVDGEIAGVLFAMDSPR
ncbi:MAG: HAD-IC family P-type ATPase, partial [Clostridia bacterium]|nr:HAD-IC family P-type ATPase [Clostridia bacterium]